MLTWHVVTTKPQQEARAAVELANQDFRVFLPVLSAKPMFPGYIFVQFDRDIAGWGTIKNTRGCIDLLRNGFLPSNVHDSIIEALMAYRQPQTIPEGETEFSLGQVVKINNGVLEGVEGLFQANVKSRTMCLLEICGKRVQVPRDTVQAA